MVSVAISPVGQAEDLEGKVDEDEAVCGVCYPGGVEPEDVKTGMDERKTRS